MKSVASSRGPALALLSRSAAAILGGYALTSALVVFLGAIIPLPKGQAVLAGSLASFAIYTVAIVWVFAVRDLKRVWLGLLLPAVLFAGLGWLLGRVLA
ncbi:DUF3649 domain-containing protein [Zestomonas carbonaria]|uniref:DUF3649 domain-containing protein n=1 Tax=Zestomonas carbonaria TaxID=2762745 RepID=A0A7U7I835_9GAMM|nr:DUF3649 domain-containing protein [Pseudomonas carbonaria]CAD5106721.1 hypothetical protein PSEWESI4_00988 [Pseudomonas carbonaria]